MDALIAIAVVALLLFLAWLAFFQKGGAMAGALPSGAPPTKPVDRWLTAPTQITVGTQATFVFESLHNNPLAITGPQTTPIVGRTIGFTTTPAEVQIVSINGVAVVGSAATGSTVAPTGQVTVIIIANSLPVAAEGETIPQGALIGVPTETATNQAVARFTIVQ